MDIFTKKVKKFILLRNKIQQVLFDQNKNNAFYENYIVKVKTGGTKSNPVEVSVKIDFQNMKNNGATIPEKNRLTAYDKAIHNAIVTLYDAGNNYFTSNMISNVLSGDKEYENGKRKSVTMNNFRKIISSLEKIGQTTIEIDTSEESRAFNQEEYRYSGNLLNFNFEKGMFLNNNSVYYCVHLLSSPPLLEYSRLRKQLSSADIKLLRVLSNRSTHIAIKCYLLQELLWMKYSKQRQRVIRYDTLQKYLGLTFSGSQDNILHQRKKLRDNVKKCFDYWVSMKFIKEYAEEKERNEFSKIVIKKL